MADFASSPTLAATIDDPLAGRVLANRYDLSLLLGEGGMGAVYRAHDRELDEMVALKLLRPEIAEDVVALSRFRREVKLARRVTHRNVARTFDLGVDAELRFLTMELIAGESVAKAFAGRRASLPEVLRVAEEVARGLAAAHAVGVVHRDLKPENVMLAEDRVVLTDFGIAHAADGLGEATETRSLIGTPAYMAPEQMESGAVDGRTDIYALGTLLYELLLGALPFSGDTPWAIAAQRLVADAPDPRSVDPNVPEPLARLLLDALARKREARPDAQTFVDRIERLRGRATSGHWPLRLQTYTPAEIASLLATRTVLVANMIADPSMESLARALTEAVVDGLTQAKISRVLRAEAGTNDVVAAGRAANADLVVQSSLHVSGERARARARLIDVESEESVWAAHADGTLSDCFDLEDRLAATVRDAVQTRTSREPGPSDPVLRAKYIEARASFDRFALPFVQQAIEALESVERASPGDPHVRGLLSMSLLRAFGQLGGFDRPMLARCEELALRALETDPRVADARYAVANVRLLLGELAAGLRAVEETVRTSPTYAGAHCTLGMLLCESGHATEGTQRIDLAIRLEPKNVIFQVERAQVHALLGERERARTILAEVAARAGPAACIVGETRIAVWWNDHEMAARCAATIEAQPGGASWKRASGLMRAIANDEPFPEIEETLAALTDARCAPRHRARMLSIATECNARAGRVEEAFASLALQAQLPFIDLMWMDLCPPLEVMRADPRFSEARATVAARAAELWG